MESFKTSRIYEKRDPVLSETWNKSLPTSLSLDLPELNPFPPLLPLEWYLPLPPSSPWSGISHSLPPPLGVVSPTPSLLPLEWYLPAHSGWACCMCWLQGSGGYDLAQAWGLADEEKTTEVSNFIFQYT